MTESDVWVSSELAAMRVGRRGEVERSCIPGQRQVLFTLAIVPPCTQIKGTTEWLLKKLRERTSPSTCQLDLGCLFAGEAAACG